MQIKGKQLKDGSVYQEKLNVTTDSIISVSSVTNAEYVNTSLVNRVEALNYSTLNLNMVANVATVGDLACDRFVIEFPISNVMVKVNNINVSVGVGMDCYFSSDLSGITIRTGGQAQKGDYLYWNSTRFDLDVTDEIDFIYITASDAVELNSGTTVVLDTYYPALNVKYVGTTGTTMTVVIDGVSFTVGNSGGTFVWDIGGLNEHTFTSVGESWLQVVNTIDYTIWYDGLGSLLFSLKQGDFTPIIWFNIEFNSYVSTTIEDVSNKLIVGGNFKGINSTFSNNIISINEDDSVDITFNIGTGFNSQVSTIIQDSNGKYIIGGGFTTYKGLTQNRICRLNQDGSLESTFDIGTGFGSTAYSIIQDTNGKYIIGGSFTTYKGLTQNYICRLNQDGSLDSTFIVGTSFNSGVQTIIQDTNGKYIIGGQFTTYKGLTQNRIIRLNQDGSLDSTFVVGTGFNNQVYSIIQDTNGKYIIGGQFTTYKGLTQNRIIRLNQDGSLDSTFVVGTGFNNQVYSIIQDTNGKYIIGGSFTTYKGISQVRICRLNQDGTLDSTFVVGTGFNNQVYSIIQDTNSKYVIGGNFTTYKGISQVRICRLNQDGTLDSTFVVGTGFNNNVWSIIQDTNGKYVIAGHYTTYKGLTQNYICKLNQDGSIDNTFADGVGIGGWIYAIIQNSNNKYIIGGGFSSYGGIVANYCSSINYDGSINNIFNIGNGFNSTVSSIIQDLNGKYVIGGYYTTYKELNQNRICRLNQDGSLDTSFIVGTGFGNSILSIIQDSNGKYIIGGNYTTYKGLTQNRICRLNQDGTLDSTFVVGTGFNSQIQSIIQDSDGKYVIGGVFTTYKGLSQNYICRLNQDGSLDSTFVVGIGFDNSVQAVIQDSNGKYVIGGYYTTYKGLSQNYICRLNQDGSLDNTFNIGSSFNQPVFSIIQDSNGKYVIGGEFTTYKGLTQNYICRLNQDGSLDASFSVGAGFNNTVLSINQISNGKYIIGGRFSIYKGITQNSIIRLNKDGSSNSI